jgi:predicted kinase
VLVILCGLPGTGKSFLARRLADQLPALIVESDLVRKQLFPQPDYSFEESRYTHRVAHLLIEDALQKGFNVISDATNLAEWHREALLRIAQRTHARFVIVQITAPGTVIQERLTRRRTDRAPHDHSDATWQVYEKLKPAFEPIAGPHLVIDTSGDLEAALAKIHRALKR